MFIAMQGFLYSNRTNIFLSIKQHKNAVPKFILQQWHIRKRIPSRKTTTAEREVL